MIGRPLRSISPVTWATALVAVLFLLFCARGALDTGLSWDEDDHRAYAGWVLDWFASPNWETPTLQPMSQYGALFGVVCTLLERLFPSTSYIDIRHLASAGFAFVGLCFAARTAHAIAGPWAGFLTAVVLATTPRWTGDAMFNPIDIPFAACSAVATYYLVQLVRVLPEPPRSAWVKLGLAVGAALGVRIGGILLFFYLGVLLALWWIVPWVRPTDPCEPAPPEPDLGARTHRARALLLGFSSTTVVAYAVACAFWPYLLTNPLLHTFDIVRSSSSFPWKNTILFRGALCDSTTPLRSYLPVWFAITLPPLFFVAGAVCLMRVRAASSIDRARRLAYAGLLLAALFPLAYALCVNATLYDGVRHFLFVIPPLAVLCGCVLAGWIAAAQWPLAKLAIALVILCGAAEPVRWYLASHPYEYTYFNPFVGGLRRASHAYETDYWGLSLRSAAEWIEQNRATIADGGEIVVATNSSWHLLAPWFHGDARVHEQRTREERVHVYVEHYRHRPPGWNEKGSSVFSAQLFPDQVPFYRIHLGPAAKTATQR